MGGVYGGFYKGEKKKKKKDELAKKASEVHHVYGIPQIEILGKKGKRQLTVDPLRKRSEGSN